MAITFDGRHGCTKNQSIVLLDNCACTNVQHFIVDFQNLGELMQQRQLPHQLEVRVFALSKERFADSFQQAIYAILTTFGSRQQHELARSLFYSAGQRNLLFIHLKLSNL
ncbi:MAG: hypothetical protein DMF68_17540 [Acidobacteria bacterium]|nr:MAG: hypothetical protein DMF68_17540 [Acidobacteriota bacterium]